MHASSWTEWLTLMTGELWPLPSWAVFTFSGALATALGMLMLRRAGLALRHGGGLILCSVVVGLLMGHLASVAYHPHWLIAEPWRLVILFKSGISSLGVYGGAVMGAALWSWLRRRPLWPYADALAPGLLIAAGMARFSCLIHGCDYGHVAANVPWAIRYSRDTPAFRWLLRHGMIDPYRDVGLPMHPFPLYEALPVMAVGAALLVWPYAFGRATGQRATAAAALYCAFRALAEHFRAQSIVLFDSVTVLQLVCILGAALFTALWWHLGRRQHTETAQDTAAHTAPTHKVPLAC